MPIYKGPTRVQVGADKYQNLAPYGNVNDLYNPALLSYQFGWQVHPIAGPAKQVVSYDLRYHTELITAENWSLATPFTSEPFPKISGGSESVIVSGFELDTTYYIAIQSIDFAGNIYELTALGSFETPGPVICQPVGYFGEQGFGVSSGTEPIPTRIVFSEVRLFPGDTTTITVSAQDRNGNSITGITIQLLTDRMTGPLVPLSLISGTALNGTWEGTLGMQEEEGNCYIYTFLIRITSASGETVVTFAFGSELGIDG